MFFRGRPKPAVHSPADCEEARILVVVCDEKECRRLCACVEKADLTAHAASSGAQAVELLAAQTYMAAVVKIPLTDMTAFELMDACGEQSRAVPCIVITEPGGFCDSGRIIQKGARACIAGGPYPMPLPCL